MDDDTKTFLDTIKRANAFEAKLMHVLAHMIDHHMLLSMDGEFYISLYQRSGGAGASIEEGREIVDELRKRGWIKPTTGDPSPIYAITDVGRKALTNYKVFEARVRLSELGLDVKPGLNGDIFLVGEFTTTHLPAHLVRDLILVLKFLGEQK